MTRFLLAVALGLLLLPVARAQPFAPGIDASTLDALFSRPPKVEVNLGASMLRIASRATASEDPDAAGLMEGLRGITVRVYSLDAARADLTDRLASFGQSLSRSGWQTLVRVRPDGDDTDDVSIFVRETGDTFDGMVVMALDSDDGDASFVFIDGPVDLDHLADLSNRFAGTDLSEDRDEREQAREEDARAREEEAREREEETRVQEEEARIREDDARIREEDARIRAEDERQRRDNRRTPQALPARPMPPVAP